MKTVLTQVSFPVQQQRQARPFHLTARELEVLALLCEGLPNKLISRRLNIAAATVKCHISRILSELGVSSRLQAVVAAARCGLLTEPAAELYPAIRVPAHAAAPRESDMRMAPRMLVAVAA